MKKCLFLSIIAFGLLFASCSSDDSPADVPVKENPDDPNNPGDNVTVKSEWEPTKIQLIKIVPVYTVDYPHSAGCTKDYLQLLSNNTAKFFHYAETTCDLTEYANAFLRNGNNVSLNIQGYQISGTITTETDTNMVIESDISEYVPIIKAMFPEYEQYLSVLEGGTVKLSLNKK